MHATIDILSRILDEQLPGRDSQHLMAPALTSRKYLEPEEDHKVACVMALLHLENGQLHISYIRRAGHPDDKHANQIGFPGGKYEDNDVNLMSCALRETEEEIGVPSSSITVLGRLSDLYIYASNFIVYPFVGFMDHRPKFKLQTSEVAGIISPSLSYLSDKSIIKEESISIRNTILPAVPYYDLYGEKLWGATAMITSEFLEVYRKAMSIKIE